MAASGMMTSFRRMVSGDVIDEALANEVHRIHAELAKNEGGGAAHHRARCKCRRRRGEGKRSVIGPLFARRPAASTGVLEADERDDASFHAVMQLLCKTGIEAEVL